DRARCRLGGHVVRARYPDRDLPSPQHAAAQGGAMSTKVKPVELAKRSRMRLSRPWASLTAIIIALLWSTPTFGLLLSSFRPEADIKGTGWWTFFANPNFTIENYNEVLYGSGSSGRLAEAFINSL